MRAVVWTEYGPPEGLHLVEIPRPVPGPHEILIRVRATSVTAGDSELRALRFGVGMGVLVRLIMGVSRPRRQVLGQEFAGDVDKVGAAVVRFRPGDPVFGTTGFGFGAYADYLLVREDSSDAALGAKPGNLTYEASATIPTGGLEALHYLRKAGPIRGKAVLVIGAGGGIGAFAVQLARAWGADVTGVDGPLKQTLIRELGAVRAIDYTREDYAQGPQMYDIIFDVVGRSSFSACVRLLRPQGSYLLGNPSLTAVLRARLGWRREGRRVVARGSRPKAEELDYLRSLVEAGRLSSPIDSIYPLERLPDAHRRVDSGLARGRVAVTLGAGTNDGRIDHPRPEAATIPSGHRAFRGGAGFP